MSGHTHHEWMMIARRQREIRELTGERGWRMVYSGIRDSFVFVYTEEFRYESPLFAQLARDWNRGRPPG